MTVLDFYADRTQILFVRNDLDNPYQ